MQIIAPLGRMPERKRPESGFSDILMRKTDRRNARKIFFGRPRIFPKPVLFHSSFVTRGGVFTGYFSTIAGRDSICYSRGFFFLFVFFFFFFFCFFFVSFGQGRACRRIVTARLISPVINKIRSRYVIPRRRMFFLFFFFLSFFLFFFFFFLFFCSCWRNSSRQFLYLPFFVLDSTRFSDARFGGFPGIAYFSAAFLRLP